MNDEITLSPFERSIVGCRGIILRRNPHHARHCANAIQRRAHPGWSRFLCGHRVSPEDVIITNIGARR